MRGEAGSTMVEFSLVSLVAFLLMFGMADFGLIILGNSVGSNAARDGARVGLINYVDADVTGSTNNDMIVAAVRKNLGNNVRNLALTVRCLRGDTLAHITCDTSSVDLSRGDLIEVKAAWDHKGYTPFVPLTSHDSTARMVIGGKPDLTTVATSPSTTSTSATTTTTASSSTTTTVAKYALSTLQMKDANADGAVDQVVASFSGSGSLANCTNTSMWTLANVPSGGTLQSVSVSVNQATLSLSGSTKNTAVGSFTVAFNPTGSCTGTTGFSATSPADAAAPVPISTSDTNGAIDGTPETGDTLTVTFSEPLRSLTSTVTTATFDRQGNGNTTLSVPVLTNGARDTGTNSGYVDKNKTAIFYSTLSQSGSALTVTLGACNTSSDCSATTPGSGTFSYAPGSSLADSAGNGATGSLMVADVSLF